MASSFLVSFEAVELVAFAGVALVEEVEVVEVLLLVVLVEEVPEEGAGDEEEALAVLISGLAGGGVVVDLVGSAFTSMSSFFKFSVTGVGEADLGTAAAG